jgi:hypothetical protein
MIVDAFAVLWAVPGLARASDNSLLSRLEVKGNDLARILALSAAIGEGRFALEGDPAQCSPSAGHDLLHAASWWMKSMGRSWLVEPPGTYGRRATAGNAGKRQER